mgnify:CR=1 FL=1
MAKIGKFWQNSSTQDFFWVDEFSQNLSIFVMFSNLYAKIRHKTDKICPKKSVITGAGAYTGQKTFFLHKWTGQKILDGPDWTSQTKTKQKTKVDEPLIFLARPYMRPLYSKNS